MTVEEVYETIKENIQPETVEECSLDLSSLDARFSSIEKFDLLDIFVIVVELENIMDQPIDLSDGRTVRADNTVREICEKFVN